MTKRQTSAVFLPALLSILCLFGRSTPAAQAQTAAPLTPTDEVNETRDTAGLFGLNGVGYFHYRDAPDAERTAQKKMAFLKQAGVTWDRFDFWWQEMEPVKGTWKWDKADWLIDFYARNGVNMLPILSYRAAWMKNPPHTAQDDAEFADYVRHVVSRYKSRVHAWEIWNEPNIPTFWKPHPDVAAYTAMMKAAYTAAHQADPSCTVVGAAANETDLNWLRGIAENGGMPYMDAVSIHPYTMADGPEQMDLARQLDDGHAILAACGRPNMPVWITEMGWTSSLTDAAANARNSRYMTQAYVIAAAAHVPHLFWFSEQDWIDGGKLQGWGLISPDDRAKPTLAAYRRLSDTLGHSVFLGWLPLTGGSGCVFENRDTQGRVVYAWAERGRTLTLPVGLRASVVESDGTPVRVSKGQITLTDAPVTITRPGRGLLRGMTARRPRRDGRNLVVNGSIAELAADGAPYGWHKGVFYGGADKGIFALSDEPGGHALSLSRTTDALWQSWPVPALPGERYTLTAQVKTTAATGQNGVQILFLSGPGWGWKGGPISPTLTGTSGWKGVEVSGVVPEDADVVRVNLVSKGNPGSVAFRDIVLRRVQGHLEGRNRMGGAGR